MNSLLKYLILIYLSMYILSCASESTIKVTSQPVGADIYIKTIGSKSSEKIGVTPMVIKEEVLEKKKLKDAPLIIELKKQGFTKESVILTETQAVDVDISLPLTVKDKLNDAKEYDLISSKLFEVQRLTRLKNYTDALRLLKEIQKLNPEFSVSYELEGSIYYLQKKLPQSLNAFNLAYSKNPENSFALRMKKIINRKIQGKQ